MEKDDILQKCEINRGVVTRIKRTSKYIYSSSIHLSKLYLLTICEVLTESYGEDEIEDYEHLRGRPRDFSQYPLCCTAWACCPEHCES